MTSQITIVVTLDHAHDANVARIVGRALARIRDAIEERDDFAELLVTDVEVGTCVSGAPSARVNMTGAGEGTP